MSTRPITGAIIKDVLGYEPLQATVLNLGGLSGAQDVDLAGARKALVRIIAEGNLAFAFDGVEAGAEWTLELVQDATGGRDVVFAGVTWPNGSPSLLRLPNALNVISFYSPDGTAIRGFPATTAAPPFPGWNPIRLENMPRINAVAAITLVSGQIRFTSLYPDRDFVASEIMSMSRGGVVSGATLAKMALFRRDGNIYTCIARTASNTSLWAVNDIHPGDIVDDGQGNPISDVQVYAGESLAVAFLQVDGIMPTLSCANLGPNSFALASPRLAALGGVGQTDIGAIYDIASAHGAVAWAALA